METPLGLDIELNEEELPDADGYESWKVAVAADVSSKGDFNSLPPAGADAEREVVRRLRDYPLERMTLIDNTIFLVELRKLLSNT